MEMCYDGALVMPSNYVAMDDEEKMYIDGGRKITITLVGVAAAIGGYAAKTVAKKGAAWLCGKIVTNAGRIAAWFVGSGFWVQALAFTCAGVLVAGAVTFAVALIAKKSITINVPF